MTMADLTDEAKAAIADAVRIVKEDRILAYMRGNAAPPSPTGPPAPPAKPEPTEEPPKEKKKGLWWGDQLEPEEPPKPPTEEPPNA